VSEREGLQAAAMNWIIEPPVGPFAEKNMRHYETLGKVTLAEAIEGWLYERFGINWRDGETIWDKGDFPF
jgi:hypothetical protein